MKKNGMLLKMTLSAALAACLLTGCTSGELLSATEDMKANLMANGYFNKEISYSVADKETGETELLADEAYYEDLTDSELTLLSGEEKTPGEYRDFVKAQVLEMTEEDNKALSTCMDKLQADINELGFVIPYGAVTFIKTTMQERQGAGIYSTGNDICIGEEFLDLIKSGDEVDQNTAECMLSTELFRVISNNDHFFRDDMHRVLGFTVEEKEPDFSEEVRSRLVKDSPGTRYDSHATFTIDGAPTEGTVVLYTVKEPAAGENIYSVCKIGVVPFFNPVKIVPEEEIPDFYDVVGRNISNLTSVDDCLAWNFSYAVKFKDMDEAAQYFPNPSIVREMHDYLSAGDDTECVTGEDTPDGEGNLTDEELDALAMEVIRGEWGNGAERVERLTGAGYNASEVQKRVNEIMKALR